MFNKNLKALREQNGLSQKEISEKLNISVKTYGHWETGYSIPDIFMLKKIKEVLDATYEELLD